MDTNINIQQTSITSEDVIILTFGETYDLDEIKEYCEGFEKKFPGLKVWPNYEGLIKGITILKKDEILTIPSLEGGIRPEPYNLY